MSRYILSKSTNEFLLVYFFQTETEVNQLQKEEKQWKSKCKMPLVAFCLSKELRKMKTKAEFYFPLSATSGEQNIYSDELECKRLRNKYNGPNRICLWRGGLTL